MDKQSKDSDSEGRKISDQAQTKYSLLVRLVEVIGTGRYFHPNISKNYRSEYFDDDDEKRSKKEHNVQEVIQNTDETITTWFICIFRILFLLGILL